jgi:hypothetical protein
MEFEKHAEQRFSAEYFLEYVATPLHLSHFIRTFFYAQI